MAVRRGQGSQVQAWLVAPGVEEDVLWTPWPGCTLLLGSKAQGPGKEGLAKLSAGKEHPCSSMGFGIRETNRLIHGGKPCHLRALLSHL